MKELSKTVPATINGKPIKATNGQLFVASLVKDGITKGPQSKALLAKTIKECEAHMAAKAEALNNAEAQEPAAGKFNWEEEEEKLYQEIQLAYQKAKAEAGGGE
jgi:hypothetical protein